MRGATISGMAVSAGWSISTHTPHAGRDADPLPKALTPLSISTHTPHAGRDAGNAPGSDNFHEISTHTPHAGRDKIFCYPQGYQGISTHTPHAGRDTASWTCCPCALTFQLTRPMRGATGRPRHQAAPAGFQLTRPMRGATTLPAQNPPHFSISTHTPHAGRDGDTGPQGVAGPNFNSHAPCGARPINARFFACNGYFNSHAPCGARL